MIRMSLLISFLILGAAGCGEDAAEPGTPSFGLYVSVSDPAGNPVAGLEAKLNVAIPGVGPDFAKATTVLPFIMAHESEVSVVVYDLEGNLVKNLVSAVLPAGRHQVVFAVDEQGQPLQGTHVYRCEMAASADGLERFRESIYITLYTSFDDDQRPLLGVTDLGGRIAFADKTEFPFLYDLGPQTQVDENSEIIGTFDFSDQVTIILVDPATDLRLSYEVAITDGRNLVELVWDEDLATKREADPVPRRPGMPVTALAAPIPPAEYTLEQNYPNPFN